MINSQGTNSEDGENTELLLDIHLQTQYLESSACFVHILRSTYLWNREHQDQDVQRHVDSSISVGLHVNIDAMIFLFAFGAIPASPEPVHGSTHERENHKTANECSSRHSYEHIALDLERLSREDPKVEQEDRKLREVYKKHIKVQLDIEVLSTCQ